MAMRSSKSAKQPGGEKTLTLTEVSKRTGISYPTLVRYTKLYSQRLPHEGTGRTRRFRPEAVNIFRQLLRESHARQRPGGAQGRGTVDEKRARSVDASETDKAYVIRWVSPGRVNAEEVRVSFDDGVLTVHVPKATRGRSLKRVDVHATYPAVASRVETLSELGENAAVGSLLTVERSERAHMDSLIDALLPRTAVPSPVAVLQARRNAEAREMLLQEFGALTSSEVAALAGSAAHNRAALANRWKQEGRLLSVTRHGTTLFPGFQFDDQGRPKAVIAKVIHTFGPALSEWELALWFTKASGWLGARRPVDLLDREPQAVIEAAERETAGFVF